MLKLILTGGTMGLGTVFFGLFIGAFRAFMD